MGHLSVGALLGKPGGGGSFVGVPEGYERNFTEEPER
jgi:hypothetical protein